MGNEAASLDTQGPDESGLGEIAEIGLETVTGLPAPVQKTLWYVLKRLTTSAVDIPAAYLEGKAAEIRAVTEAKIQAIKAAGTTIAEQIDVPPAYLDAASTKFAARIVGKQKNLDAIVQKTVQELKRLPPPGYVAHPQVSGQVNDDWLNVFESEAENMASDYMRDVFSKLLAGEVRRPGTFSRRAVKILGQMEKQEAEIFALFCSLAVQFTVEGEVVGGLLLTLGEHPATNGLKQYGLDYRSLMTLIEYGLVLASLDGYQQIDLSGPGDDLCFYHGGKFHRYIFEGQTKGVVLLHGITTTRVGTELMQLVTPIPHMEYSSRLEAHLKTKSLRLDEVR